MKKKSQACRFISLIIGVLFAALQAFPAGTACASGMMMNMESCCRSTHGMANNDDCSGHVAEISGKCCCDVKSDDSSSLPSVALNDFIYSDKPLQDYSIFVFNTSSFNPEDSHYTRITQSVANSPPHSGRDYLHIISSLTL